MEVLKHHQGSSELGIRGLNREKPGGWQRSFPDTARIREEFRVSSTTYSMKVEAGAGGARRSVETPRSRAVATAER